MRKTIYNSKTKGIQWDIDTWMTFPRDEFNYTEFNLLPAIEYVRSKAFEFENDHCFSISFKWLFWKISINRYWGEIYKK